MVAACLLVVPGISLTRAEPPVSGHGTLRLARLFDPVTLDPVKLQLAEDFLLMPLLHQGLLDVRDGTNLVPCAARAWSTSPDKRVYTCWLRPGVRFSNGREVVARDYAFVLERTLNPASAAMLSVYLRGIRGAESFAAGLTNHVAGISTPAPDMLVVELDRPDPTFGFVLMNAVAEPPEEVARLGSRFAIAPVGTGPYVVEYWRRGARLHLVRNAYYCGTEPQHLDGVDLLIGGDETTHLMMFERGELDLASIGPTAGIPFQSFRRLSQDPRWRGLIEYVEQFTTQFITLNTEIPPLDNVLVRRAINHAINRDKWTRVAAHYATHGEGALPRILPGFNPALRGYEYNPDKARQRLRESGVTLPLHTVLWHALDEPTRFLAQGTQGDLSRVGIEVELKPVTFAELVTAVGVRRHVPMAVIGWGVSIPDPIDMLGTQFNGRTRASASTSNFAFYENAAVDGLLDLAAPEINLTRRYALYQQAEQVIVEDAPWVFLNFRNLYSLRQPWLKGPLMDPLWSYRLDRVWIEK